MDTDFSIRLEVFQESLFIQMLRRLSCFFFGHKVDNRVFEVNEDAIKKCPCGRVFLQKDGSETRICHTVSCFLLGHPYQRVGERNGHNEYVCLVCGHPLLFKTSIDLYGRQGSFKKKVRYLCNLFGHDVHEVTSRGGYVEYSCSCGHSFLKPERGLKVVRHPPICTLIGHLVCFVESRGGYSEFLCRHCGHTFCFLEATR